MSSFLLGVPGRLKTLLDRMTAARAARLDADISSRMPGTTTQRDRIDISIGSRADQASVDGLLAAVGDLENGATLRSEEFLSSGTFTAPKTGTYWVTLCGGGGGAPARHAASDTGYGGFGALCIERHPVALTAGAGVSVTVAAGGNGGHADNTNGVRTYPSSGGASEFGSLTAVGGSSGYYGVITSEGRAALAVGTHPGVNDTTADRLTQRAESQRGYRGGRYVGSSDPSISSGSGGGAGPFGPGGNAGGPAGEDAPSGSGAGGGVGSVTSGGSNGEAFGGNGGSGRVIVEWVE